MKTNDIINMAEKTMRGIVHMARNPLVSRRGNMAITKFLEAVKEPEPKKKVKEPVDD